ncbi:uncharacterized protein LOC115365862 [Myripristis murdjan]|uniref:uncharacterized protein LOC115365862 n=1 Tax=Myripristis murdjan TaxID=586833 RepID=UPI001175E455|nr:uncharacterized protein LOC115365862 [Myripristis murdjan]
MEYALFYFKVDKTVEVGPVKSIKDEDMSKVDTSETIKECPDLTDDEGWINVKWTSKGKKKKKEEYFLAKVLLFSDDYSDLCKKREDWCQSGADIWATRKRKITPPNKLADQEDRPAEKKQLKVFKHPMQQTTEQMKKKAADDMVEALKKEIMTKKSIREEDSEMQDLPVEDISMSDDDLEPDLDSHPTFRTWGTAMLEIRQLKEENKRLREENLIMKGELLDAVTELSGVARQLKKVLHGTASTTNHRRYGL